MATLFSETDAADVRAVACGAFEPITYSRDDTDATIRQVRMHNAAFLALCEGAP